MSWVPSGHNYCSSHTYRTHFHGKQKISPIAAPLAHRVAAGADSSQIADAISATWQEIAAALTPIIGQLGIAALYRRAIHLTVSAHPWLAGTLAGAQAVMDLALLESAVGQQSSADAIAGGDAMFKAFRELLSSLIGPSLTERLLRSVWATPLSGPTAQDTAP